MNLRHLRILDMTGNGLENFDSNTFDGLVSLKDLHLCKEVNSISKDRK